MTLFDSLLGAIQKAADYNRDDTVPRAGVLWPSDFTPCSGEAFQPIPKSVPSHCEA